VPERRAVRPRARPSPARLTRADVEALGSRVDALREQHATRISRCETMLEQARAARLALRDQHTDGRVA
jgi:hypothetical protein